MDSQRLATQDGASKIKFLDLEPETSALQPDPSTTIPGPSVLSSSVGGVPSSIIEHNVPYFLEKIMFLVDGRLLNVPSYHFVHSSPTFMMDHDPEGVGRHTPVVLAGVSELGFERLLRVMYPLEMTPPAMSKEEWISVLRLSTKWRFDVIRKYSIGQLALIEIDPIEKVMLAREYGVSDWLELGYQTLSLRPTALSLGEAENIGHPTAFSLSVAREKVRVVGPGSVKAIVRSVFAVELKDKRFSIWENHRPPRARITSGRVRREDGGDGVVKVQSKQAVESLRAGPPASGAKGKKKKKK